MIRVEASEKITFYAGDSLSSRERDFRLRTENSFAGQQLVRLGKFYMNARRRILAHSSRPVSRDEIVEKITTNPWEAKRMQACLDVLNCLVAGGLPIMSEDGSLLTNRILRSVKQVMVDHHKRDEKEIHYRITMNGRYEFPQTESHQEDLQDESI